jgi:hypothetical protein
MAHTSAVALLPALVAATATQHAIRTMLIKGPVLAAQSLRAPRHSSDADVLIDPKHFERFCALMSERGWSDRDSKALAPLGGVDVSPLAPHSLTLLHPQWPSSIDVHRFYPGFLANPQAVFDELWKQRGSYRSGNYPCSRPSRIDHWLLAMLHIERSPRDAERTELLNAARDFSPAEREALAVRSVQLGAAWPLEHHLAHLGIPVPAVPDFLARARADWLILVSPDPHDDYAVADEMARASLLGRVRILWRAAFPPEQTFRMFHNVGPRRRHLYAAYAARVMTRARRVPRMLVTAWKRGRVS